MTCKTLIFDKNQKSEFWILMGFKRQLCVCWGLANSWDGGNDVQSHLFAIIVVLVLLSHSALRRLGFEPLISHFASRCLLLDVCFWIFAATSHFHSFVFSLFRIFAVLPELLQFSLQFSSPSTVFALLFRSEFDLFEFAVELVR